VTMAAAVVAVLAAGGLIVSNLSGTEPDGLARIADELANSDGIRFVLSSESSVDIASTLDLEPTDSNDIEQLSTAIPRCEERVDDEPTVNDGLDLGPIIEAIATTTRVLLSNSSTTAHNPQSRPTRLSRRRSTKQTTISNRSQNSNRQRRSKLPQPSSTASNSEPTSKKPNARSGNCDPPSTRS